jgi:hypothetical protein
MEWQIVPQKGALGKVVRLHAANGKADESGTRSHSQQKLPANRACLKSIDHRPVEPAPDPCQKLHAWVSSLAGMGADASLVVCSSSDSGSDVSGSEAVCGSGTGSGSAACSGISSSLDRSIKTGHSLPTTRGRQDI